MYERYLDYNDFKEPYKTKNKVIFNTQYDYPYFSYAVTVMHNHAELLDEAIINPWADPYRLKSDYLSYGERVLSTDFYKLSI
jgi:hypothetical protein